MSNIFNFINKSHELFLCRSFYLSHITRSSRDGRFMKKILKDHKSKKKWQSGASFTLPSIPSPTALAQGAIEGQKSPNSKRIAVLNKLFMKHITDLMATGENSGVFLGKGIEINRVAVTPDFKGVNVFWIAKGTNDDEKLAALLSQQAGALRHELSQLRVMGVVPMIHFVKDREYAKIIEVDLRLARADFGADYVPVEPSYKFRSNFYLNTTLSDHVKEQIDVVEGDQTLDSVDEPLPAMRMDVLGLNHSDIMTKIHKGIKKSQALHRKSTETKEKEMPISVNEDPVQFTSNKQQREAFTQFLLKRQILQAKAKREKEKYYPEYEYFKSESSRSDEDTPFAAELTETDYDYIDDQEDNKKL